MGWVIWFGSQPPRSGLGRSRRRPDQATLQGAAVRYRPFVARHFSNGPDVDLGCRTVLRNSVHRLNVRDEFNHMTSERFKHADVTDVARVEYCRYHPARQRCTPAGFRTGIGSPRGKLYPQGHQSSEEVGNRRNRRKPSLNHLWMSAYLRLRGSLQLRVHARLHCQPTYLRRPTPRAPPLDCHASAGQRCRNRRMSGC